MHVKTDGRAPAGFFEAEAAGLRWLAEAGGDRAASREGAVRGRVGARIARVVSVQPGRIELEAIEDARPTPEHALAFGRELAATHGAGADAFGAPPTGWTGPCFIGRRPMEAVPRASWGDFYAAQRVLPFARIAVEAGGLTLDELGLVERVCDALVAGAFDDDEAPARLHGDLWNGNVLFSPTGVVLIDPAAHGGHRETDLAMLALFGCPFLDDVLAGYDETAPLRAGWEERVPLHQLHPLAVHAAGHGRGYGRALVQAAQSTLALLD